MRRVALALILLVLTGCGRSLPVTETVLVPCPEVVPASQCPGRPEAPDIVTPATIAEHAAQLRTAWQCERDYIDHLLALRALCPGGRE